eukprot:CAMPEP_0173172816 /NCGR_PEP_ID=MMETSP1141-20130122/2508_1 /TAXON_ID=483371 /ORGANISM="non described non described, Strain CCMP2298" /LENGTH=96 /DNA_ID=CAMNT_0014094873 /DNA_START=272 /DNA_END=563 /DNA_ORIENTATION=+
MPVGAPSLLATPTLGSNNPSRLLASTSAQSIGNHPACSPLSALEKVPLLGGEYPPPAHNCWGKPCLQNGGHCARQEPPCYPPFPMRAPVMVACVCE